MKAFLPKLSKKLGEKLFFTDAEKGCGSFLDPPNHPNHKACIKGEGRSGSSLSVDYALKMEPDEAVLKKAFMDYKEKDKLPLSHQEVKKWMSYVYGYFGTCYSKDGKNRDVSEAVCGKQPGEMPDEKHLGFLLIKEHYPGHKPSKKLIREKNKNYGQSKDYQKIVKKRGK